MRRRVVRLNAQDLPVDALRPRQAPGSLVPGGQFERVVETDFPCFAHWVSLCPANPTGRPEQGLETPRLTTDPFAQSNFNVPEDAFPVARLLLPEKTHCRIQGRVLSIEHPSPVRHIGQERPHRFAKGTSKVSNRSVNGNNQIELLDSSGGNRKVG